MSSGSHADSAEEYVMNKIVDHLANASSLFWLRVCWYEYDVADDIWEPVNHLTRSQVLWYARWVKINVQLMVLAQELYD